MDLTGYFDPRRHFVPPIGWQKFSKAFAFYKMNGDVRLNMQWDGHIKKWVLTASRNHERFFTRSFEYSYDAFNFAETIRAPL